MSKERAFVRADGVPIFGTPEERHSLSSAHILWRNCDAIRKDVDIRTSGMAVCTFEHGRVHTGDWCLSVFHLTNGVYCMKKIVAGIGFEITGMFMVLCFAVVTGLNIQNTTSWYTSIGQYWQTAINMGMIPICIIGFVLLTAGIAFSLWGIFSKSDQ